MQPKKLFLSIDCETFKKFAAVFFGKKVKDLFYEGVFRIRISYTKKLRIAAHRTHTPVEVSYKIFCTKETIDKMLDHYAKVEGIHITHIEYPGCLPPKIIFAP
jgi:hypothetical protein